MKTTKIIFLLISAFLLSLFTISYANSKQPKPETLIKEKSAYEIIHNENGKIVSIKELAGSSKKKY